ncbi:DUF427 domain-containing protein [Luedemannella flava]
MNDQRGRVRVEPGQKRVRVYLRGELIADTRHPLLVWEVPYFPTYYIPVDDVLAKLRRPRPPTGRRAGARAGSSTW